LISSSLSFRWNMLINEIISGYQEFTFFSLVGFVSSTTRKDVAIAAIVLALLVIGVVVMFVLLKRIPGITKEIKEKEQEQEDQQKEKKEHPYERYSILFKSFKSEKLSRLFLVPLLLLRSLGFSFVLVFLSSSPVSQMAYLYISTLFIIGYAIKTRPFHEKKQLILTISYEVLLLAATGATTILHVYNQSHIEDIETRSNMAFGIIYVGFGMTMVNFASFFVEIYEAIQEMKFKAKAKKVVPMGAVNAAAMLNFEKEDKSVSLSRNNSRKHLMRSHIRKFTTGSTILPLAETGDLLSDFETPQVTPRITTNPFIQLKDSTEIRKNIEDSSVKEDTPKKIRIEKAKANQSIFLDMETGLDSTKETPKANYRESNRKPTMKFIRELNLETILDEEAVTTKVKHINIPSLHEEMFSWNSIDVKTTSHRDNLFKRRTYRVNTANSINIIPE